MVGLPALGIGNPSAFAVVLYVFDNIAAIRANRAWVAWPKKIESFLAYDTDSSYTISFAHFSFPPYVRIAKIVEQRTYSWDSSHYGMFPAFLDIAFHANMTNEPRTETFVLCYRLIANGAMFHSLMSVLDVVVRVAALEVHAARL